MVFFSTSEQRERILSKTRATFNINREEILHLVMVRAACSNDGSSTLISSKAELNAICSTFFIACHRFLAKILASVENFMRKFFTNIIHFGDKVDEIESNFYDSFIVNYYWL